MTAARSPACCSSSPGRGSMPGCVLRAVGRDRPRDGRGALRAGVHGAGEVVPGPRRATPRDDGPDACRRAGQLHLPTAVAGADRRPRLARRARSSSRCILAAITVPLHALRVAPRARAERARTRARPPGRERGAALLPFWLLSAAFVARLADRRRDDRAHDPVPARARLPPGFAAFAVGLVGISQIPGRLLFAAAGRRVCPPRRRDRERLRCSIARRRSPSSSPSHAHRRGRSPGSSCSAWATGWPRSPARRSIADLYGAAAYGTIASVAGGLNTAARAAGPVAAASTPARRLPGAVVDARGPLAAGRRDGVHGRPLAGEVR